MSKGSPIKAIRINQSLLDECAAAISKRNAVTRKEPWDFTDFMHAAIREKLAKMERSRSKKKGGG